eukprot:m.250781 g.250781  ORF g.250781 m.250781 type:complete len:107 (-) comp19531_c0_seq4:224-544(-)
MSSSVRAYMHHTRSAPPVVVTIFSECALPQSASSSPREIDLLTATRTHPSSVSDVGKNERACTTVSANEVGNVCNRLTVKENYVCRQQITLLRTCEYCTLAQGTLY